MCNIHIQESNHQETATNYITACLGKYFLTQESNNFLDNSKKTEKLQQSKERLRNKHSKRK